MTISTTIIKVSYSGNGTQTVFPYTFKINAEADIQVIIRASNGTETVKTLSTDYSVSGVGSASGGNITMVTAPTATETIVIRRETSQTQTVDLVENDPFTAETVEGAFDKSIAVSQELQEEVDRSIKLSRTNTMTSTEFTVDAATRANKILAFDASGEIAVTQELGTYKGNWASGTSYSARDIVKDTSNNNIYISNTAHTSSGSQPLSSNTDSAKWDLLVDAASATSSASAAATSATNAANSATAAATSASNASTSESNAATSATTATTQATNASNSASAAQTAQAAAEAALDNFDDRFLGAKATDPTLDNDGNALQDGALYFDTTNDIMKVYDLTNTTWRQLTLTSANQTNVNTVAGQISPTNNIATVAGLNTEITNVSGLSTEITNLNGIRTDISSVNSISTEVQGVYNNTSNINAVYNNATNINTVAGLDSEITLLGTSANVASITTAANNLTSINSFANTYLGPSSTAPTQDPDGSALDVGDLYFDTTSNVMKVYSSSGWVTAASAINGTSDRFTYTVSSSTTTITGADDAGNTLAYDAGYIDVYLNGVRMVNGTDVTVTSGTSVVFASAIGTSGTDVVDIVAFGTFQLANFSVGSANDVSLAGISDGQVLVWNAGSSTFQAGNASSAEVYGFSVNSSGQLIVTTTGGGADNIDAATYATFDDVVFAASGFTWSIDSGGNLIATI
jgi:hypothetical protein